MAVQALRTITTVFDDRFRRYYLLVTLLLTLLLLGWVLRVLTGSLSAALSRYETFFQLAIAGILIATFRNEFGIKTYGLFAPAVISFVFVSTGLLWGMALFLNIFVISLGVYYILEPFTIGTAHRVGTIMAVVSIAVASFLVLGDIGLLPRLSGTIRVFFPAILTAWYAERFATDVEERGWSVPSIQLLWTLVTITVAYAVISARAFIEWFLGTPEAWVAVVTLSIVLGATTRVRLKEYYRFSVHYGGTLAGLWRRLQVASTNLLARLRGDHQRLHVGTALTMNVRNRYIRKYNPGHLRNSANKVEAKRRFLAIGIPTPVAFAIAEEEAALDDVRHAIETHDQFVLKPDSASGGEGIVVVRDRDGDAYRTGKGDRTANELLRHARRIIQGQYSGLRGDGTVIVEERIEQHPFFEARSSGGVADIRVLVFKGYPLMSMVRLPTAESGDQANLHKGAVGVGLSIADGTPLGAYQQTHHRWLTTHPDTGTDLTTFQIPVWDDVLDVAVRAAGASGLGYAGVDIAIDSDGVPQVFEVNASPGLGIQNTTRMGLLRRLQYVESLAPEYEFYPPERKVELARRWDREGYQ
ncbi:sugar-transfer associated ATP-grasp domain-containing protein [Haloarcula salina]|uniref:sugar-transfer associated ATP-grasp domain-containing protein n=1 Tax=Haloarcula salina TaxID=1429914 RepID=UPI003C704CD5